MTIISPLTYTFVNGITADGTQVQANLAQIVAAVNASAAPLLSPALTGGPTAPTPAASDSSTLLATTAFVRGSLTFITPEMFGAVGNGIADDTAAIQAAITALGPAGDGVLWFSAKTYLITAGLTATHPVTLRGIGAGMGPGPAFLSGGSVIKAGAAFTSGDMFAATTYYGVTVQGIRFDSVNQRVAGAAVHISSPGGGNVNYNSLVENCGFNQQYDCITLTECEVPTIQRNLFTLWSNYGVHLDISSGVEGSFGFIGHNNFFNVHANGTLNAGFAAIGGNGGYGFIHHNVIVGSTYGVNMTLQGAGATTTATLLISGNQFEEIITDSIALARVGAGVIFSNVVILGNEFANITSVAGVGAHILLQDDGVGDWLSQVVIAYNVMSSALTNVGAHHIDVGVGTNVIIQGNTLNNLSASASVIAIRTTGHATAPIQVLDNSIAGFSTGKLYDCTSGTVVRDQVNSLAFADLGSWANGSQVYVSDGRTTSPTDPTLRGGGGGCVAVHQRATWYAPYGLI